MARNILLITSDQQRYDSLGCNGGTVARTPVIDALAAGGVNYQRAYNQNTVCMPARSTILTGQYPRTHGVIANGIPLPVDAPSVSAYLGDNGGYRTALLGKAHFEPGFDLGGKWEENNRARRGDTGPWRGFDRSIQAMHSAAVTMPSFDDSPDRVVPLAHYGRWLVDNHPEYVDGFASLLLAEGGGDTGAPETKNNPIPTAFYHTDWIADLAVAWLGGLDDSAPWFCWVSFPDPHHPWDPPASELDRVPWQDLSLPPGHPGSEDEIRRILGAKPAHWLGYYDGTWRNREGGPATFVPSSLTDDQIREVNAKTHVMNELIDEACGRILSTVAAKGWESDTDVLFTTDHGELQGDMGLLFKGPYHVDALMRLPLVWRPAPSVGVSPGVVPEPVGQVDIAPTLCAIAGLPVPEWMEGQPLPESSAEAISQERERVLCEWDSQFPGYGMHLRSIVRDGWLCTVYEESTDGKPNGLEKVMGDAALRLSGVHYQGDEGELYRLDDDPWQWENRWSEPSMRAVRDDLVADLYAALPEGRSQPLEVEAPA